MGAAFCACLPLPGVFSSVRKCSGPSLGVSSGVPFVQSREELSTRLLQPSSPQTWPILQLAITESSSKGAIQTFWCSGVPPHWGTASLPGSVPTSPLSKAHQPRPPLLGLPWLCSAARGSRVRLLPLSLFWQLKHFCFLDRKGPFFFSTEFGSDALILHLFSFGSDPLISTLVTASSISANAENVKHPSVPFEAGHAQPQNLHLRQRIFGRLLPNQSERLLPAHKTSLEY